MKNYQVKKGFSLVEVIISLAILSISLVVVSTLMAGNIGNSQNAKNQMIAAALAQEAVELVRNVRDNLAESFSANIASQGTNDFRIDAVNPNLDTTASYDLFLNSGFYTHNPQGNSKFHRKLVLEANDPEAKLTTVTILVAWNVGSLFPANCTVINKCVSLSTILPDKN